MFDKIMRVCFVFESIVCVRFGRSAGSWVFSELAGCFLFMHVCFRMRRQSLSLQIGTLSGSEF